MGRLTVSIPDPLEATLDAYASERGLPVSQVVAEALRAFFGGGGPPPSPVEDAAARAYLARLAVHVEHLRLALGDTAGRVTGPLLPLPHAVPEALSAPEWPPLPV